ncbi:transporter substrate-binding domain-containing protein [Pseudomonas otitidis]|uniref:Transporter substrate-binding domain-containing protein n=1 Tax=Metapseudomonas otitidis TaxID=319939 RepID=A0A7X3HCC5_9GAMM|nr:transporter substrate-binding domain-containing protein [Pseudomonas otitidis]MWK59319.1 transporter substrate-binding domain-containing protein [Pseudomonas otitidis]
MRRCRSIPGRLACAGLLVGVLPLAAQAQGYVVGVENLAFQPHYQLDESGQYRGFGRDLLDLFARSEGLQLEYRPLPVNELAQRAAAGEVDLRYPDNPEWAGAAAPGYAPTYSAPVVAYVDGVLVDPRHAGQGLDGIRRLALVKGWTPRGYQSRIEAGQVQPVEARDLRQMINQTLRRDTDGAYFNVVVATYYLDNVRARPGALVFDPSLPHTRSHFHLSSVRHPELVQRFDRFLGEHAQEVAALKARYRVEANLDSAYMGMEQWKVDFLERQKRKEAQGQ